MPPLLIEAVGEIAEILPLFTPVVTRELVKSARSPGRLFETSFVREPALPARATLPVPGPIPPTVPPKQPIILLIESDVESLAGVVVPFRVVEEPLEEVEVAPLEEVSSEVSFEESSFDEESFDEESFDEEFDEARALVSGVIAVAVGPKVTSYIEQISKSVSTTLKVPLKAPLKTPSPLVS